MSPLFADIDDLAARFVACVLPQEEWTHLAHLAVGTWHVHKYGPEQALTRLRVGISRLNESHGRLNSPTSGYHETVTGAYILLLSEFLDGCPKEMPLNERVASVIDSPIADKGVLFKFYSRGRLNSAIGRAAWVEPDLAPLRLATVLKGGHKA